MGELHTAIPTVEEPGTKCLYSISAVSSFNWGDHTTLPNWVFFGRVISLVTRTHAMGLIGQHVVFRTRDGVTHHGTLQSVTSDGIYVRAIGGRGTRLANGTSTDMSSIVLLQDLSQSADHVKQAFFPFFFFPFFALAFLWPWAWWWY